MHILLCGATGKMGKELNLLAERQGNAVTAIDPRKPLPDAAFADVLIDFSHPDATAALLAFATKHRLPFCSGTTGRDRGQLHAVRCAAEQIPVFCAASFSLGIALLERLLPLLLSVFPSAELEITETHHHRKADAPSGTALALANAAIAVQPNRFLRVGRSGAGIRDPMEIGIHSVRIGEVVGVHELRLDTGTEAITLCHTAHDRSVFAQGALYAARFLQTQPPGFYGMADLFRSFIQEEPTK